ncbi:hypothetical protein [Aggregatilinea lenta]|nr:hypothetical protein [Aggregatilinea lenta]
MSSTPRKSNLWTSGCLVLSVMGLALMCWLVSLGYMSTLHLIGM